MIDPFFHFLTQENNNISQKLYGKEPIPFKEYPDLVTINLPEIKNEHDFLYKILQKRESSTGYSDQSISLEVLSEILKMSVGLNENNRERRVYPSGGGKYPTDIYIYANRVENLGKAIYHYGPKKHSLVKIKDFSSEEIQDYYPMDTSNYLLFSSAIIIFITFSKDRSIKKYGNLSYKLGLIEAGHIGQNFYLSSESRNIGCRAHAGGNIELINSLLNIDGISETLIYTLSLGIKKK
jgi:SagB-type dehydrogenase family enzyme